jgi:hypothetical protein
MGIFAYSADLSKPDTWVLFDYKNSLPAWPALLEIEHDGELSRLLFWIGKAF